MKISLRAGSILAFFSLSILGCDPAEPITEAPPKHDEHADSKQSPPTPEPAVVPSTKPLIPASANPEAKADEKMDVPKSEPKTEPPK